MTAHDRSDMMAADTATPAPEARPIASGFWKGTLAGGIFKVLIAALALTLPLVEHRPLPLWVGGMLVAGGLAELAVAWDARQSILGKIALSSGIMTVVAGAAFMATVEMGFNQLTVLTMIWLMLRGLISLRLTLQASTNASARFLLLARGATDLGLGLALIAGLSVLQIAVLLFGSTPAMATGFLAIIAISFGVAGIGLIVIALSERSWERRNPNEASGH